MENKYYTTQSRALDENIENALESQKRVIIVLTQLANKAHVLQLIVKNPSING